jgi:phosphoglycerate dehydrogenase-like enzyme
MLIVSQHADEFATLLAGEDLPDLDIISSTDGAITAERLEGVNILFGAPDLLSHVLPRCSALQWVQSSWAGVRPLIVAPQRNYLLTGLKGVFGQQMSEYALAWMLAFARNVLRRASERRWNDAPDGSLAGSRLGIMGAGSIGADVARACHAMGMSVFGMNSDGRPVEPFEACYASTDRLAFADGLDYLLCLLPETPYTDNLVDSSLLHALAPGAVLINGGRGNCIVESDLLAALDSGPLAAAVLDVLREEPLPANHPLWGNDRVYITSHTAAPTLPRAMVGVFCDNYRRFLAGEPLLYPVDFERGY